MRFGAQAWDAGRLLLAALALLGVGIGHARSIEAAAEDTEPVIVDGDPLRALVPAAPAAPAIFAIG